MQFFKSFFSNLSNFLYNIHQKDLHKRTEKKDWVAERKVVASIIMQVLTEKKSVREALLEFPKNCTDNAVGVAWHALIHLEADENISQKDSVFHEVQIDFLEGLHNILSEGKDLPENLINEYNKYHKGVDTFLCSKKEYFWHEMKKNISIEP